MIDEATCKEIDKVIAKTLKDADFEEPPFFIDELLVSCQVSSDG